MGSDGATLVEYEGTLDENKKGTVEGELVDLYIQEKRTVTKSNSLGEYKLDVKTSFVETKPNTVVSGEIYVPVYPSTFINPYKGTDLKDDASCYWSQIFMPTQEAKNTVISHNPTYFVYEGGYFVEEASVQDSIVEDLTATTTVKDAGGTSYTKSLQDVLDNWSTYKTYELDGVPLNEIYEKGQDGKLYTLKKDPEFYQVWTIVPNIDFAIDTKADYDAHFKNETDEKEEAHLDESNVLTVSNGSKTETITAWQLYANWETYENWKIAGQSITDMYDKRDDALYEYNAEYCLNSDGLLCKIKTKIKGSSGANPNEGLYLHNSRVGLYTRYKYSVDFENTVAGWGTYRIVPEIGKTTINGKTTKFSESCRVVLTAPQGTQIRYVKVVVEGNNTSYQTVQPGTISVS